MARLYDPRFISARKARCEKRHVDDKRCLTYPSAGRTKEATELALVVGVFKDDRKARRDGRSITVRLSVKSHWRRSVR